MSSRADGTLSRRVGEVLKADNTSNCQESCNGSSYMVSPSILAVHEDHGMLEDPVGQDVRGVALHLHFALLENQLKSERWFVFGVDSFSRNRAIVENDIGALKYSQNTPNHSSSH